MQSRQIAALATVIAIIALALGAILGYGISSGRTTVLLTTQSLEPSTNMVTLTQFFTSTATSNMTVTLTQITTLPPNEIITKIIIFEEYILFPVITSTNCGVQYGGGPLDSTSVTETSYVATTTASVGTTVTIYDHETTNSIYEITDNNLATTYATVIDNTTITTTSCVTAS